MQQDAQSALKWIGGAEGDRGNAPESRQVVEHLQGSHQSVLPSRAPTVQEAPMSQAELNKLRLIAAEFIPGLAKQLGASYESSLYQRLGDENYLRVAERIRSDPDPDLTTCHVQNLCDANQLLIEAFSKALGRDFDAQCTYDRQVLSAGRLLGLRRLEQNAFAS